MKTATANRIKVGCRLVVGVGAGYFFGRIADTLPVPEAVTSQIGKVADRAARQVGAWACGIAVEEIANKYVDDLVESVFEPVIGEDRLNSKCEAN